MAVHNGRAHLAAQLRSVLGQLEAGDELIVVDDASSDDGLRALQDEKLPHVRIVVNARNLGAIRSFECGLGLAQGEVVFLCDQDDIWLPGKRAAFVAAFERDPRVLVVISDSEVIDAQDTLLAPSYMATRGGFHGSVLATLWRNRFLGCAMAVRRPLLAIALPFPASIPMHDMWLGALGGLFGRIVYLPQAYLRYRRHAGNLTPLRSTQPWTTLLRWRAQLAWCLAARAIGRWLRGGRIDQHSWKD
jgi:glycosyltransferase involved in cell wall biosynthesis